MTVKKKKYFGTDGIRGEVGKAPIIPDFILRLGYAAGSVLKQAAPAGERCTVLIGKDTRVSGYLLEAALEAGFSAAGVDVMLCGPMPSPGVAFPTILLTEPGCCRPGRASHGSATTSNRSSGPRATLPAGDPQPAP